MPLFACSWYNLVLKIDYSHERYILNALQYLPHHYFLYCSDFMTYQIFQFTRDLCLKTWSFWYPQRKSQDVTTFWISSNHKHATISVNCNIFITFAVLFSVNKLRCHTISGDQNKLAVSPEDRKNSLQNGFLGMKLNGIWWWGSSFRDLRIWIHSHIAITPKSTLIRSS